MGRTGHEDPELDARVRRNLKRFREESGYSADTVSTRLGGALSSTTIHRIETGERPLPGVSLLKRLVETYGHTMEHLWEDEPPPSDPGLVPVLAPLQVLASEDDAKLVAEELAAMRKQYNEWDLELRAKIKRKKQRQSR